MRDLERLWYGKLPGMQALQLPAPPPHTCSTFLSHPPQGQLRMEIGAEDTSPGSALGSSQTTLATQPTLGLALWMA